MLVLAHPPNGDTCDRLAGGFEVSATTVWRYIREAVDLLAAAAPTLERAMRPIGRLAYAILDGTLILIDRVGGSANRRYFSGEHKRHGVNVQSSPIHTAAGVGLADAARLHPRSQGSRGNGIIDALTRAVATFADKGYRGARGAVGVPFYGRHLPARMREVNSAHAKIRSIGERAIATLKTWKVLTKLHCCPQRATPLLAAILMLQLIQEQRESG